MLTFCASCAKEMNVSDVQHKGPLFCSKDCSDLYHHMKSLEKKGK